MISIRTGNPGWFTLFVFCSLLFGLGTPLRAQSIDAEVASYLEKIEKGQNEEVRKVLPDLAAKHPNNPGVMYLQGKLSSNGVEAAKYYQTVVDNFPRSEWADDALFGLYQ